MKKICRWACRHRAGLLALAAGFAAWGLFYIARRSTAAMDWWLTYVSMPVKRGLSFIVDPLPFSACELGATVLIVGALVLLARAVRRRRLAAWALHMAVLLVWGYAGVCALWGTQYYGTNFAARAGMTAPPVSTGELAAVTDYFADKVNAAAPLVQRDESGVFATDKTEIFAGCAHLYDPLTERWPFLAGPERRPKPAIYSKLMSAWGFTGYLCPLVGESTLNVDSPAVFLPVTIAHELAHQRGVAAEQEANFVGVMAATASANADSPTPAGCSATCTCPTRCTRLTPRWQRPATRPFAPRPAPTWPPTTPTGSSGKARSSRRAKKSTRPFCRGTARTWVCAAMARAWICLWKNF